LCPKLPCFQRKKEEKKRRKEAKRDKKDKKERKRRSRSASSSSSSSSSSGEAAPRRDAADAPPDASFPIAPIGEDGACPVMDIAAHLRVLSARMILRFTLTRADALSIRQTTF
jgi:hypothetical protein